MTWSNANAAGRVEGGVHSIKLSDHQELADAINIRRLLTGRSRQNFSSRITAGAYVRADTMEGSPGMWFDPLRSALAGVLVYPPAGWLGGNPQSPEGIQWLWPVADSDENKIIVPGSSGVLPGQVGLFQKLNGTTGWTDGALTATRAPIRAVHLNELRRAAECLSRIRWTTPIYFTVGLFSMLPDSVWVGQLVVNSEGNELRTIGMTLLGMPDAAGDLLGLVHPAAGPTSAPVTARPSSAIEITADRDCSVEIYHCLRPVDFADDRPTWNQYLPGASAAWSTPGGTGAGDATLIGSLTLTANQPVRLTGSAVADALNIIIAGAAPYFLARQTNENPNTATILGRLIAEMDLTQP